MRKIGTMTTAISFIFLGVALLLSKFNEGLAYTLFKFWPMLIIVLGLEFIYISFKNKEEAKSYKFSFLTIFVLIIFLITDSAWGFLRSFDSYEIRNHIENSIGYFNGNKTVFKAEKELSNGKMILKANNCDIDIESSNDKKVIFDGYIQTKNNKEIDDPMSYFSEEADKTTLNFNKEDIGYIEGTLYVPNGISIEITVNNGTIESYDDFSNSIINIDSKNSDINLKNFKEAHIKNINGDIELNNVLSSFIENVNGAAYIKGNSENIDIENKNDDITIDNNISKNIKIRSNNGNIILHSNSADAVLNANTNYSNISFNGKEFDDYKNLNKTFGHGNGNIDIYTKSGDIDIRIKE